MRHGDGRASYINGRMRKRRIAALRQRRRFERMDAAERAARLDWLAQLSGKIERGFAPEDVRDAEAALLHDTPCDVQPSLPFGVKRDA